MRAGEAKLELQKLLNIPEDKRAENIGPLTVAAFEKLKATPNNSEWPENERREPPEASDCPPYTLDDRSAKNVATLAGKVKPVAIAFLGQLNAVLPKGTVAKIISGTRTYEEQTALYAQGRSKPGKIVTKARAGYSNHNFGVAFDIGIFRDGAYITDGPHYDTAGAIGKSVGLEWGGDWKTFKDRPHFEYKTGLTLAQMRARKAAGQAIV